MIQHIPYSRRKIIAVREMDRSQSTHALDQSHIRLQTAPAPWTTEEKWRSARYATHHQVVENVALTSPWAQQTCHEGIEFDKEQPTMPEPDQLDILVDAKAMSLMAHEDLIGMGLRGRWALMGVEEDARQWWTFKAKDCEFKVDMLTECQTCCLLLGRLR